jgi:hypothetical protein
MAGAFQLGDIINFGRLAWEVYQYGWINEFNACEYSVYVLFYLFFSLSRYIPPSNKTRFCNGSFTSFLGGFISSCLQLLLPHIFPFPWHIIPVFLWRLAVHPARSN